MLKAVSQRLILAHVHQLYVPFLVLWLCSLPVHGLLLFCTSTKRAKCVCAILCCSAWPKTNSLVKAACLFQSMNGQACVADPASWHSRRARSTVAGELGQPCYAGPRRPPFCSSLHLCKQPPHPQLCHHLQRWRLCRRSVNAMPLSNFPLWIDCCGAQICPARIHFSS